MLRSKDIASIEIFKALGDSTRFKILKLLSSSGNNLCVTAISKKIGISQPVISQHLKILKNAKIVNSNRIGYYIHYSINEKTILNLENQIKDLLNLSSDKCSKDNYL